MKFYTPNTHAINDNVNINTNTSKIVITKTADYYSVKAVRNIKKSEIILIEYPKCVLYGEYDIDRGLQVVKKYMEQMDTDYIKELYPRDFDRFNPNTLIKNIHKIINYLDTDKKHNSHNSQVSSIIDFFKQYSKRVIEFYYAKYIYNAFEGFQYGPLTLPILAKFNHSCKKNNIEFKFDTSKGCMIVSTTCNVKKDDELFNSYLYNKNIENHKAYIFEHYNFDCGCKISSTKPYLFTPLKI